jgi:hypothetical protein
MADPKGLSIELQPGRPACLERRVDEVDRVGVGRAALDHRVDDLAQGGSNALDAGELGLADPDAGVGMDQLVLEEPDGGIGRLGQVLVALVLIVRSAVSGVERVEEVERRLQIDAVRVLGGRDVSHVDNHSTALDRLRASGYCTHCNQ